MSDRINNKHRHRRHSASILYAEETNQTTRPRRGLEYKRHYSHLPQAGQREEDDDDDGMELTVPSSLFSTQLTQISNEDGNSSAYAVQASHHHHHHQGVKSLTKKHSKKNASILLAPDDETQVYIPEDMTEDEDSETEDSKGLDDGGAKDRDQQGFPHISFEMIKNVNNRDDSDFESSPHHALPSRMTSTAAAAAFAATAAHSSPACYRTTSSLLDTIILLSDAPIGETPCVMIKKKGGTAATTRQFQGEQLLRQRSHRRQQLQEEKKGEEEEEDDENNTVSKKRNRNEGAGSGGGDGRPLGAFDDSDDSNNNSNYSNIIASSSMGVGAVEGGHHIPQSPMSPSIRRVRLERLQELEKKRKEMLRQRQRREQQVLERKRQRLLQQQQLAEKKQVGKTVQQKIKKTVGAEVHKGEEDESSDESFSEEDDFDDDEEDDDQGSANEDYASINKQGGGGGGWWSQQHATRGRKRYILTAPPVLNSNDKMINNETGAHGRNYEREREGENDFDEEEARDRRRVHALLFGETRCRVLNCGDTAAIVSRGHQHHGESCEDNVQEGGGGEVGLGRSRSEFSISPRSRHTGQSGNTVVVPASRRNNNNSTMRMLAYDNPRVVVVPMALSNNAPVPGKPILVRPAPTGNVRQKCRKQRSEGKPSEEKRGAAEEKAENGCEEVKKKRDMNVNKGWWARPANVGFYDIGHFIFNEHAEGRVADDHCLEDSKDGQAALASRVDNGGGELCLAGGGGMATKRPRSGRGGGSRSQRTSERADFISLMKPLCASDVTLVGFKSLDFSAI